MDLHFYYEQLKSTFRCFVVQLHYRSILPLSLDLIYFNIHWALEQQTLLVTKWAPYNNQTLNIITSKMFDYYFYECTYIHF